MENAPEQLTNLDELAAWITLQWFTQITSLCWLWFFWLSYDSV